MERGRCQPLQERWLSTVRTLGDEPAVTLAEDRRVLSFRELQEKALASPRAAGPVVAEGRGLTFLLEVLRAWRDDAVLLPREAGGAPLTPTADWPDAVCQGKMTSGSTGSPRDVLCTAAQLAADADQIVSTMGLRRDWPNLGVISMAHSYGFSNLVLPLLLHGIPLILVNSPLPEALRQAMRGREACTLAAVPAMWRAWHAAGLIGPAVKLAISAGAPLPLELEQAVHGEAGVKIHNFYGSSECGGIAFDRTLHPRTDPRCAGSAMDGVTLSVDAASGCLLVRSPAVASGYAVPDPVLERGVFRTSDLVRLEGGEVWLEGRASEAINVAGRKIPPSVIEEKLLGLDGVRHCVVFGLPSADAARVDEIAVCVNLSEHVTLREVRQAGALVLPAAEQPRHWRVCRDLEPDGRGKISRAVWRQRWPDLPG